MLTIQLNVDYIPQNFSGLLHTSGMESPSVYEGWFVLVIRSHNLPIHCLSIASVAVNVS